MVLIRVFNSKYAVFTANNGISFRVDVENCKYDDEILRQVKKSIDAGLPNYRYNHLKMDIFPFSKLNKTETKKLLSETISLN